MLCELVLAAGAMSVAYYIWSRRRLYRLAKEIPSPFKSYPIIGVAYIFAGSGEDRMKAIQKISDETNKQGGLGSAWFGNKLFISITDPLAIEVITKSCLDKDEFTMRFTRTVVGNGLTFAPVNIWQKRHKIAAPFFALRNVNRLVPVFNTKSFKMADLMRAELGGGEFPAWKYFSTYSFDAACETSSGMKMNTQEDPDHFLLRAISELTQMISERMVQPWLHPDFIYERLPVYKRFQYHFQQTTAYLDEQIKQKRKELAAAEFKDTNTKKNTDGWVNYAESIIQASGGLQKGYSDLELREELMVMVMGGSDTSATGSSYTAVLLSQYPEVQERVYQELQEVFGDSNREVTVEDLSKLKYLDAVIKESVRLYPPVPIIVREVRSDVLLPSGPTLVPGTSVIISIWGTHRNRAYWGDDADSFRPERFLEGPLRHPAQFMAFSNSVRGCIGSTYAMLSMKTAMANVLRRYRLLPAAGASAELRPLPVEFNIIMRAVDNFMIKIEERNKYKHFVKEQRK